MREIERCGENTFTHSPYTYCTVHATEVRKQIFGRIQTVCVFVRACSVTCEAHECVSGSFPPTSLPVHSILYCTHIGGEGGGCDIEQKMRD